MNHAKASGSREQRTQERLEITDELIVTDANSGDALGQLANLSIEGLMLASMEPVRLNTEFRLRVPLSAEGVDDACILVGAESLWCEDINGSGTYWTGFHINDISPEHQAILEKIVQG